MSCKYYRKENDDMCKRCVCRECPRADEEECRLFWMIVADECDRGRPDAGLKCVEEWTHYEK